LGHDGEKFVTVGHPKVSAPGIFTHNLPRRRRGLKPSPLRVRI
jgi:hypothetical protein